MASPTRKHSRRQRPLFWTSPNNERFNKVIGQPNVEVDEKEGCLGEYAPAVLMKILYGESGEIRLAETSASPRVQNY